MNGIRPDNTYEEDYTVPSYMADRSFHLRPSSFMDMAQEIAHSAASHFHFGWDDLQLHHTAWVISRMHFKFIRPPKWRDDVALFTWHKCIDGPFYIRDFELRPQGDLNFEDSSGALITCTSSWIVMNMQTRAFARDEEIMRMVPESTQCHRDAIEEHCKKVVPPKDAERFASHKIMYSDVDFLGHTNNARYIAWSMDSIGYEITSEHQVKDVRINFNKETKPGDEVELFRSHIKTEGQDTWFIEGKLDGKSCFCTQIDF